MYRCCLVENTICSGSVEEVIGSPVCHSHKHLSALECWVPPLLSVHWHFDFLHVLFSEVFLNYLGYQYLPGHCAIRVLWTQIIHQALSACLLPSFCGALNWQTNCFDAVENLHFKRCLRICTAVWVFFPFKSQKKILNLSKERQLSIPSPTEEKTSSKCPVHPNRPCQPQSYTTRLLRQGLFTLVVFWLQETEIGLDNAAMRKGFVQSERTFTLGVFIQSANQAVDNPNCHL